MFSWQSLNYYERVFDETPFRRLVIISATDRIRLGPKNVKKFKYKNLKFRNCDILSIEVFNFIIALYYVCRSTWLKSTQSSYVKYKKKKKCLKNSESSYWRLNFENPLVLWCATSEVKMEAGFEVSMKLYSSKRSLELSNAVWNFFGTP